MVRRYARFNTPALLLGETGTGKELIARALHQAGPRREGPFVTVSCPNLPLQLIESELFGHRRGAFTGASENRTGAFELADGGTLFLDEIGDMPLEAQVKLLRVLQEGTLRRLGESREVHVDVRVIAATWRDLPAMVKEGSFREDLYNRLAWCVVQLPPLRDRGHDVVHIARALLKRGRDRDGLPRRSLSREAEVFLRAQPWPGNVRQLERVLFQATATATGRSLRVDDLQRALGDTPVLSVVSEQPAELDIEALLHAHGPMRSAELRARLGISRSTLARHIQPLRAQGHVIRVGRGAATSYRFEEQPALMHFKDRRWALACVIARRDGQVTRGTLSACAGISERTATRVLGAMVEAGVLIGAGGRGRSAGYTCAVG